MNHRTPTPTPPPTAHAPCPAIIKTRAALWGGGNGDGGFLQQMRDTLDDQETRLRIVERIEAQH